jgi:hypothetical protein
LRLTIIFPRLGRLFKNRPYLKSLPSLPLARASLPGGENARGAGTGGSL